MKGHLYAKDLEKWKKADLQELAQEMGVSTEGTVKELAARIAAEEVEVPDEEVEVSDEEVEVPDEETKVSETDTGRVTVKVTEEYRDLQAGQTFNPGVEFETTVKRAAELEQAGVAKII